MAVEGVEMDYPGPFSHACNDMSGGRRLKSPRHRIGETSPAAAADIGNCGASPRRCVAPRRRAIRAAQAQERANGDRKHGGKPST